MTSRDPMGKRALFSEAAPAPTSPAAGWNLTVHCSACGTNSPVSVVGFMVQHLPVWMWLPWKDHPHLMRCPACGRLAWHSVS